LRSAAGISKALVAALIPLLVWVLISALLLYLIEVRSIFILGGEPRLRIGVLAFALGVILIQRLTREQTKAVVQAYAYALGFAMIAFTGHQAYAYQVPGVHPLIVFFVNAILFAVLWWVGHTITKACSVDSDAEQEEVVETGILYHTGKAWRQLLEDADKKEEPAEKDDAWTERMSGPHPGRVIFYFSLFAIPAFGLGFYLFDTRNVGTRLLVGGFLFVYLWCAFALLALSHLRQLAAYLAKRGISLPDVIGFTWLSVAGVTITLVLLLAVLLPQPPSLPGLFVRHRVITLYRGWESEHGLKDSAKPGSEQSGTRNGDTTAREHSANDGGKEESADFPGARDTTERLNQRYRKMDKQVGDKYLSELSRNTGWEPELRNAMAFVSATNDAFRWVFDLLLKILLVAMILCVPLVLYLILFGAWQKVFTRLSTALHALGKLRIRLPSKQAPAKGSPPPRRLRFMDIADPFALGGKRDVRELIHACWEAMLAFCADHDAPCPPHVPPLEFVMGSPEPLRGFEESAFFIACLVNLSEFSNGTVPDETCSALREFWSKLQRHALVTRR
jgi:hypothetical protein